MNVSTLVRPAAVYFRPHGAPKQPKPPVVISLDDTVEYVPAAPANGASSANPSDAATDRSVSRFIPSVLAAGLVAVAASGVAAAAYPSEPRIPAPAAIVGATAGLT